MPSAELKSQQCSPFEEVGQSFDWSGPRMELWVLVSRKGPLTAAEILGMDNGYGDRFRNRGNLFNYLHDLRDAGYLDVERRDDEQDLWHATTEPDDEVSVDSYTTVSEFLDAHFPVIAGALSITGSGVGLQLFALLRGPLGIGSIPDILMIGGPFVLVTIVAVAVLEVHL